MAFLVLLMIVVAGLLIGLLTTGTTRQWFASAPEKGDAQLWTCSMHPQVIQDRPGLCPICHMELSPLRAGAPGTEPAATRRVKYWWDPMLGPSSISNAPGKSAMGMDLEPVYEDQRTTGADVIIDPVVVQNMGVRVAEVTRGSLELDVRAFGILKEAEPLQHDVNLRVSGWIENLYADTEGMHVSKGDPLFDLYSPRLRAAIEELISARAWPGPTSLQAQTAGSSESIYAAAKAKLRALGVQAEQVEALGKLDRAPQTVMFISPISGHVVEKAVVAGSAVAEGQRTLRIVDHTRLWLDAQIYESQLPYIRLGQAASATLESMPGKKFEGEVVFIHPHVDSTTRTVMVRLLLSNESLTLRPGMYATVQIHSKLADDAVIAPRDAIIDTGERQLAFIAVGQGRFEPRTLKLGASTRDGKVQVVEGLLPGELVVTSGQFLLDSESRLKEAIEKYLSEKLLSEQTTVQQHRH